MPEVFDLIFVKPTASPQPSGREIIKNSRGVEKERPSEDVTIRLEAFLSREVIP